MMFNFKKVLSLIMTVVLIMSLGACNKSEGKTENKKTQGSTSEEIQGGYSSNTEEGYDDTVDKWQNEDSQNGEGDDQFDNQDGTTPAPTPGSDSQEGVDETRPGNDGATTPDTDTDTDTDGDSNVGTDNDSPQTPAIESTVDRAGMPDSDLYAENLQYLYKGSNYAYGITADGEERIAFKDEYGKMVDVLGGAGRFVMSASGSPLFTMGDVVDFTAGMEDSYQAITVLYDIVGGVADVSVYYVFKENNISVSASVNVNSTTTITSGSFARAFVNDYIEGECKINMNWHYPSSGDQPYKVYESLTYRNKITEDINLYTFLRSEGLAQTRMINSSYKGDSLPMDFEKSKGLSYTLYCSLAFVDTNTETRQAADYLGMFKGLSSDFAAGIAPINPTDDHSTVFIGDKVDLNINVTNLTEDDLTFSLRYDVRDYYGNVVDKGIFVNSTAFKYSDANRKITVGGKYGMYFLNIYVITKYSTYRDHYPFALLPEHEYKYMDTAPWGINSPASANQTQSLDFARVLYKIGSSSVRVGSSKDLFLQESRRLGITQVIAHYNPHNSNPAKVESYTQGVMNFVKDMAPVTKYVEIGNEYNLFCLQAGGPSEEEAYPVWYKNTFEPTFKRVSEEYPDLIYIPTPDSACSNNWLNQFVNGFEDPVTGKIEGKVWDKVKVVSTHIYGPPYMPDIYSEHNPNGGGLWHIESGMSRMKKNLERLNNGDVTKTDFVITEIGYTSPPMSTSEVDYRTQADYMMRTAAITVAYSADLVQFFRVNDRTGYYSGYSTNREWHFGFFYEHDYYGRLMPKPVAAAFGAMTRQLESYKKNSAYIDSDYDEGWDVGGARVMALDTVENGIVRVAWSNYEVLPNGKKDGNGRTGDRNPTLPWESQWKKTDDTVFYTDKTEVRVADLMGNIKIYKAKDGKVTIPLTGSPVYIYDVTAKK